MTAVAFAGAWSWILVALQITAIDLLLSADNAVVIALACRGLPAGDVRTVAALGTAGAVLLRLAMAAGAALLLQVSYLKLVGAATLLAIAVQVTLARGDPAEGDASARPRRDGLLVAVGTVVAADAVMSLDNVVAVAAVAKGDLPVLGLGLALSVPMLVWGSTLIRRFLDDHVWLVVLSGMFLGWLAGDVAVSDPGVARWIAADAPALPYAVPLAGAIFVFWQHRILSAETAR